MQNKADGEDLYNIKRVEMIAKKERPVTQENFARKNDLITRPVEPLVIQGEVIRSGGNDVNSEMLASCGSQKILAQSDFLWANINTTLQKPDLNSAERSLQNSNEKINELKVAANITNLKHFSPGTRALLKYKSYRSCLNINERSD